MAEGEQFKNLSNDKLAEIYVATVLARAATEHVGRINRLFGVGTKIARELRARGVALPAQEQLSAHRDPEVRAALQAALESFDPKHDPMPPRSPRTEYLWQCDNPPPPAMTREQITQRLRRALPAHCD